ncbi:hypothetical protein [uncultured Veillonella sp.]|jgi:hypothetical protein|uniref:hypothetical protein n=1 Tax=uncultured Veillonella sp. TaxID=159268 RepID=UPI0020563AF6|nr:hypothetical protein [uncultured Veillonella sp.]DAT53599.1 MAG TPA: hypothetical protein [Caudoviricetes sp.]
MSKIDRPLPRVDEIIIDEIKQAFSVYSILKRDDLNAEQKIAYITAVEEITNYLNTCREANGL